MSRDAKQWVVFTSAPSQIIAEGWQVLLRNSGIPCKVHPGDAVSFMGVAVSSVRLMTTQPYLERARAILAADTQST